MKYAFVKMINPQNGKNVYIEPRNFERYKEYPVFRDSAKSLVIMDKVYIGAFELLETDESIKQYNEESVIIDEISLKDIAFKNRTPYEVSKLFNVDNA